MAPQKQKQTTVLQHARETPHDHPASVHFLIVFILFYLSLEPNQDDAKSHFKEDVQVYKF